MTIFVVVKQNLLKRDQVTCLMRLNITKLRIFKCGFDRLTRELTSLDE